MPRTHCSPWIAALAATALAASFASQCASGADPARGRGLYEERCGGCHAASVHGRAKRVARDFDAVRDWVRRWNDTLMLRWSDPDVEDVTVWLNTTYYGYPCPPSACKVLSMAGPGANR